MATDVGSFDWMATVALMRPITAAVMPDTLRREPDIIDAVHGRFRAPRGDARE
ncbi:MAG: hypothetical protein JOY93_01210 [Acidobacteriales bacterium]|nr:hypothetical protein [Terriglobales bacterium]